MQRRACLLAAIVSLFVGNATQAQPRVVRASAWVMPPAPRGRAVYFGALGGGYSTFVGGWGNPYAIIEPRTTIQVFVPAPQPQFFAPPVDVSGIDLDVAAPPWAHEFPRAPLPAKPKPQLPEVAKRIEPIKQPPEKGKPIDPAPAPAVKDKLPDADAKADPIQEGLRMTLAGLTAFRGQEYGLAARKFSQAIEADPKASRAYFFLGQAHFALGKYSDAVQSIGLGLGIDPTWPKMPFRPRFDLYADHPEDWQRHAKLLEDAQARQPNHVGYLFLLAHQRWFDDRRDDAIQLFIQARKLVADPSLVDLFLKAKGV